MNKHIERIQQTIEPLRQQIINHKVYSVIEDVEDLQLFMHYHVYAVWDFMSLLKALQNNLTCTSVPWFPKGSADTRYLINEIVIGEESDVDSEGNRKSHYELYLDAMQQAGADTAAIGKFMTSLQTSGDLQASFSVANTPEAAREFVNYTFEVINSNKDFVQAAIFTFGREDLIPGMFISIVSDMHRAFPDSVATFKYYLERHIEVDGDHHSQLALQMTANLCGDNEHNWQEAEAAVVQCLQKRLALWDGVYQEIAKRKELEVLS